MKRYQGLKAMRITVSVAVAAVITLLWIEYSDLVLGAMGWIEHTQIIPAGMALSGVTILFLACDDRSVWQDILLDVLSARCRAGCGGGLGRMSRKGSRRDYHYSPPMTRLRYCSLAVVAVCLFTGLLIIPAILDPYSMYSAFVLNVLKPVWGWVNNAVAAFGVYTGWWTVTYVSVITASLFGIALSVVSLAGVAVSAWISGRPFCNTICPVGTVLGVVSARSLWHIDIDTDLCTNCRKCEHACKAHCIDLTDHVVDGSRCVGCFDCLTVCPDDAIFYRPDRKQLSLPMMQSPDSPEIGRASACSGTSAATSMNTDTKGMENALNTISDETISRTS